MVEYRDQRLARCAALLIDPGDDNPCDPRRFAEGVGIARIERCDEAERVIVQQLNELREPRAQEHHIGRGEREREPLGWLVAAALVRVEGVVAELPDGETAARIRRDVKIHEGRVAADGVARRHGLLGCVASLDGLLQGGHKITCGCGATGAALQAGSGRRTRARSCAALRCARRQAAREATGAAIASSLARDAQPGVDRLL